MIKTSIFFKMNFSEANRIEIPSESNRSQEEISGNNPVPEVLFKNDRHKSLLRRFYFMVLVDVL